MAAGIVPDEHDLAEREFLIFRIVDGRKVEIEHSMLRVEDFDIAGDRLLRALQGNGIDPADFGGYFLSEGILRGDAEKLAGRTIEKHNFPFGINDDEAFLQGLEHIFQKALLLDQTRDDLVNFFWFHPIQAGDELF